MWHFSQTGLAVVPDLHTNRNYTCTSRRKPTLSLFGLCKKASLGIGNTTELVDQRITVQKIKLFTHARLLICV